MILKLILIRLLMCSFPKYHFKYKKRICNLVLPFQRDTRQNIKTCTYPVPAALLVEGVEDAKTGTLRRTWRNSEGRIFSVHS